MTYSYRTIKSKLDDVLEKLQDPATDIDDALKLHVEAEKLVAQLESYLKDVEKRIKNKA